MILPSRVEGLEVPKLGNLSEFKSYMESNMHSWSNRWQQEGIEQGMQQGMQQGIQQGREDILLPLLQAKFGTAVTDSVTSRLQHATSEQAQTWARRILDAESLDEVFRDDDQDS